MDINLEKALNNQNRFEPETALKFLKEGNERFYLGKSLNRDLIQERNNWSESQNPYAVILTCSDSRVAPEIIFDEPLGRLFVIRIAGNVITDEILGTIEFAFLNLNVGLLLILGHESCAAIESIVSNKPAIGNIYNLVQIIIPAVEKIKNTELDSVATLNKAIEVNVQFQSEQVKLKSEILRTAIEQNKFSIVGGVYNLHNGMVELI